MSIYAGQNLAFPSFYTGLSSAEDPVLRGILSVGGCDQDSQCSVSASVGAQHEGCCSTT